MRPPSPPSRRRVFWLLTLAVGIPTVAAGVVAWNAANREEHNLVDRERARLRQHAALRARELDSIGDRVRAQLDRRQPIRQLDPGASVPTDRRLVRRLFVLDADGRCVSPRLPYRPDGPREVPWLVLNDADSFVPFDGSGVPLADVDARRRLSTDLDSADADRAAGRRNAALTALRRVANATDGSYFGAYARLKWAQLAEATGATATPLIEAAYRRIRLSRFEERLRDLPVRLEAALGETRVAFRRTGETAPVANFLRFLYGGRDHDTSRAAFQRIRAAAERLADEAGFEHDSALRALRDDLDERIALVERVFPVLERPAGRDLVITRIAASEGDTFDLAYRSGRARGETEYVEGAVLDLGAPDGPIHAIIHAPAPAGTALTVLDTDARVIGGDPVPPDGRLSVAVRAGPDDRFVVRAYHVDPDAFDAERSRWHKLALILLGFITLSAVAAGTLAYRGLARELALARLKTEFIAGVSHELRTPLTTIQMFGEMLALGRVKDPERVATYHRAIHDEADRLRRMIDDLLDFGRMEAAGVGLSVNTVDPAVVVSRAVDAFRNTPRGADRVVRVDAPDGRTARLDAPAVERALLNLIVNAAKYSDDDQPIDVRAHTTDETVTFTVEDRGIGIPKRYHRRLFETFFRVPSVAVNEVSGSGLGLALVDQIARAHGGEVDVDSSPGRGSRFSIRLPVGDPPDVDNAPPNGNAV